MLSLALGTSWGVVFVVVVDEKREKDTHEHKCNKGGTENKRATKNRKEARWK
jgi:hypothetical protein